MTASLAYLAACGACLAACGDNRLAPSDAAPDAGPFEPAPHAPMPVVLPHTRSVLTAVQLVTLTFDGYAARGEVEAFGDRLVASSWYHAIGAEYGLLPGTHVARLAIGPAPASITRDDIAGRILDLIARNQVPRPSAVDNQLLYLIYIPPAVTRGAGIGSLRGYHEMRLFGDARFPIAVVLDDDTGLAATTKVAAHQVINAVTDPYAVPKEGYYSDPPKSDPWSLVHGELADLCEGEDLIPELDVAFPRVYSNTAAAMSLPPCMPGKPDDSWSTVTAEPWQIQSVPAGSSIKFRLTGWSTRPLPDWKLRVEAAEFSNLSQDEMRPQLSSDTINNNVTVTLVLHAPFEAISGAIGGVYVLSGANQRPWAVGFSVR